jgi:hypothetical protein
VGEFASISTFETAGAVLNYWKNTLSQADIVGWCNGTPVQQRQYKIVKESKRFAKAVQAKVQEEKSSEEAVCLGLDKKREELFMNREKGTGLRTIISDFNGLRKLGSQK